MPIYVSIVGIVAKTIEKSLVEHAIVCLGKNTLKMLVMIFKKPRTECPPEPDRDSVQWLANYGVILVTRTTGLKPLTVDRLFQNGKTDTTGTRHMGEEVKSGVKHTPDPLCVRKWFPLAPLQ
jgi:hypothetical protein